MNWKFWKKKRPSKTLNITVTVSDIDEVKKHLQQLENRIDTLTFLNKKKDREIRKYRNTDYKELRKIAEEVSKISVQRAQDIFTVMSNYLIEQREQRQRRYRNGKRKIR